MAEDGKPEEFDPETLSPEAREFIRRQVQSESDTKARAVEQKLLRDTAQANRSAAEKQENIELQQLAEDGDFDSLGRRVAKQLSQRSVEADAMRRTSDVIEEQMVEQFTPTLGAEVVEQIRAEVTKAGGAHADFAQALSAASVERARGTDMEAEVTAVLVKKGLVKREEIGGADEVGGTGGGTKPTTFDEIETAYGKGEVSTEVYEEAQKNR